LDATSLGLPAPLRRYAIPTPKDATVSEPAAAQEPQQNTTLPLDTTLPDDDPLYLKVKALMRSYGGVVLRGPPGTSKSWYASMIAARLVDGDSSRLKMVQFHPSYQYEDFVEGYVPRKSGFQFRKKHFRQICDTADAVYPAQCVLVIDELSRTDAARVLGEALTYLEASKRGIPFELASGRRMAVPDNLLILATMNVHDRGVDEVDAALERRFGMIALEPSKARLEAILDKNEVTGPLRAGILSFFDWLQRQGQSPGVQLGHAYFQNVRNLEGLELLWEHQLQFVFQRAFPLQPKGLEEVSRIWHSTVDTIRLAAPEPLISSENVTTAVPSKAGDNDSASPPANL
jgi:5-methylcytosine-specific restriction protein B